MNTRGFRPVVANSAMSWMRARSFASPSPEIPTFSGRPWMYSKYCVLVMKEFSRLTSAITVYLSRAAKSLSRSGMNTTSLADMNIERSKSFYASHG